MKTTIDTLKKEFKDCQKIKIFEIAVINNNLSEYITFDISIENDTLTATGESLSLEDYKANKCSVLSVELDDCFSLDEHLQSLYELCTTAIIDSPFYTLT